MSLQNAVISVAIVGSGVGVYYLAKHYIQKKKEAEAREVVSKLIADVPEIIKPSR
ncbi:hypothetical protein PA10_00302 [Pseudomonas phage pPa_SNUABM_DT01]|nr:hypothetical protein PA10_00302 [Pseudomonas phage pPa_SNUABM_DT01]